MDCETTTTEPAAGYYFARCSAHGTSSGTGVVRSTVEYRLNVACATAEMDNPRRFRTEQLTDDEPDADQPTSGYAPWGC